MQVLCVRYKFYTAKLNKKLSSGVKRIAIVHTNKALEGRLYERALVLWHVTRREFPVYLRKRIPSPESATLVISGNYTEFILELEDSVYPKLRTTQSQESS